MEANIDNTLVKSESADLHVHHLNDIFQTLRRCNMKLNPTKYSFRVKAWKILRYLITQ